MPNEQPQRTPDQLATILYRYEQYKGGGFTGTWMIQMDYVDLATVSDWAYEAMCWMNIYHSRGQKNAAQSAAFFTFR